MDSKNKSKKRHVTDTASIKETVITHNAIENINIKLSIKSYVSLDIFDVY